MDIKLDNICKPLSPEPGIQLVLNTCLLFPFLGERSSEVGIESEAKTRLWNSALDHASPSLSPAPPKNKSAQTWALLWYVLEILPKTSTLWVGEGKPAGPLENRRRI